MGYPDTGNFFAFDDEELDPPPRRRPRTRSLGFHLLIFVTGFLLAIVFSLRSRLFTLGDAVKQPPAVAMAVTTTTTPIQRGTGGPSELRSALARGTYESFQTVRAETVSLLPNYRQTVLPVLKEEGLTQLLRRFNSLDWREWPVSFDKQAKAFSPARIYIDDLRLANPELARFLETASLLLHDMYQSISAGNSFNASADLYYLMQNAEQIFSGRSLTAVPARTLLDATILENEAFKHKLEVYRGKFTADFARRHPDQLEAALRLFLELKPALVQPSVLAAFRGLVVSLALRTTAKYRQTALSMMIKAGAADEFLKADPLLSEPLAQLYLMSALDALQRKDREGAKGLLQLSLSAKSGLEEQAKLQRLLEKPLIAQEPVDEAKEAEPPRQEWFEISGSNVELSEGGLQNFVVVGVILIAAIVVGGRLGLSYLSGRAVKVPKEKPSHSQYAELNSGALTSPSDLAFDDELLAVNKR